MNKFDQYRAAVNFLESFNNTPRQEYMDNQKNPEIYLKRMEFLAAACGHPERRFKFIHVTGTSGKGSTATYIHSILTNAGYNAGLYTSPFPTTSIENIKVKNNYISPDEFVKIVNQLKPILAKVYDQSPYGFPSYSEIFLAVALIYFAKKKCDYVVLEVGCGGRYDQTNIIPAPEIAVITNIGKDHLQTLGKTLTKIAWHKAGIIKTGSHLITAERRPRLLKIFQKTCQEKKASIEIIDYKNDKQDNTNFLHPNAVIARKVAERLKISTKIIDQAIKATKIPIRLEIIQKKPLVILDGAHNEDKMKFLVNYLKNFKYQKLHVVFAMKYNKDATNILTQILPITDKLYITRFLLQCFKAYSLKELSDITKQIQPKLTARIFLDPYDALKTAQKTAGPNDLILITGSIYMVGELRKCWVPEDRILEKRSSF